MLLKYKEKISWEKKKLNTNLTFENKILIIILITIYYYFIL